MRYLIERDEDAFGPTELFRYAVTFYVWPADFEHQDMMGKLGKAEVWSYLLPQDMEGGSVLHCLTEKSLEDFKEFMSLVIIQWKEDPGMDIDTYEDWRNRQRHVQMDNDFAEDASEPTTTADPKVIEENNRKKRLAELKGKVQDLKIELRAAGVDPEAILKEFGLE